MAVTFDYLSKVCVRGNEETGAGGKLRAAAKKDVISHTCGDGEVDSFEMEKTMLSSEKGRTCLSFLAHITCRTVVNPVKMETPETEKGK